MLVRLPGHEPASRPVGRIIAQGQRNENRGAARNLGARCLKSGTGRAAARRRQGRAAVEKRSVGDRILNEWCASFVSSEIEWVAPFDEYRGCERADCGLSFYPSCSAILRRRGPHSVRYRAGEGASKGCCSQMGAFSRDADIGAQRTQCNSGRSRARASLCKWTFLCTRRSG